ncbi:flagellar type III secretion system pore protein FliP [Rhodanobacter sp. KK11]|jgi:flagellar biosynthetic protein FliP|uniref:flagellar type III secretion system pore protein FliP n=1 Tax=Rhodanobacter sp. KK11 TaxID=3083255 RepID=UPI00296738A7|nr:flagellar type III secretion system pore protein FliP [Rhodanobacter sp. KK11]MDW2981761.1 flagellar type III secretion system pore protein FliP [Rhodanobacter sp. KK11]
MSKFPLRAWVLAALVVLAAWLPATAMADPLQDLLAKASAQDLSPALRSFLLLTLLSIVPLLLISLTSFTRIVVVLSLLRSALGLQQTPPNSVLVTLALFLTLFTMSPVLQTAKTSALDPYLRKEIAAPVALEKGFQPLKVFMVRQTRKEDLLAVVGMAGHPAPRSIDDISALELVPAFMLSELRTAFQIGFVIFLPFLLIDLVVAAILMALGMIMVPPSTVSLPLKILLFLLINGWSLVAQALLSSFHPT